MSADLFADIVQAKAMQITVSKHWKNGIELSAPLESNLNDKGTAFAGSISSMLTLAGWALITHLLNEAGVEAEVMVVKSSMQFSVAVRTALKSVAEVSAEEVARVFQELETRGRSRICIDSSIPGHAFMTANFAIIQP